ncbi:Peptidase M3A/M3B [Penicillium canariense]|uniref:Peptidase M3A/M3B n=1 Tax=Penicillium canariense TaxID=189055 RepID=A0A9W9I6L7_9EURO|nr:Peptidase M3A/M3B [Penicillium canariense]KAJ5168825.1 Peptidase M3A/M3B [Penicillium canariense]
MANTTDWVKSFLSQLEATLCPRGRDEIAVLQHRRLEDMQLRRIQPVGDGFPPWDKQYYDRLVKQEFDIDHLKISEFFPLERIATGMLGIFASLLGLRFDPIPAENLTAGVIWHDTVQVYSVWDASDDRFIGYLYLDLLWRKYKYRENQCVNIQCVRIYTPAFISRFAVAKYVNAGLYTARWKQTMSVDDSDVFVPDFNSHELRLAKA